jgi:hypothetical protein
MALINCKECAKEVSQTAKKCPHCGVANPGVKTGKVLAGIILLAVVFTILMTVFSDDISVDSDDLTGNIPDSEKYSSAPSIYLSNTENRFFTLSMNKSDITPGNILLSKNNEGITFELSANWDGEYFVESTNHDTVALIEITNIDKENHTITIDISAKLVEPKSEKYIMMDKGSVVINNVYL